MKITSTAFQDGEMIPVQYTCDGEDVSPPLEWQDIPYGTESLALISDDPDAPMGTWVHWVIYNIPASVANLPKGMPRTGKLMNGERQGTTDFGRVGYGGPCPPGGTHRYYFKLYALDRGLDLKPGITKEELLKAMDGHILAEAQLMGRYERSR
ncbi:MAG: YbhB/YbcL family Raf kinase inhibitor-like protein [Candidatus Omnitrophica bacterium]|nr:YbhB/YbcL family Raf kinase inhibitor-like protein [Candidatus Omnitrophota bacterium]